MPQALAKSEDAAPAANIADGKENRNLEQVDLSYAHANLNPLECLVEAVELRKNKGIVSVVLGPAC